MLRYSMSSTPSLPASFDNSSDSGRLDIITGPMFAGKSTELLRRLNIESILPLKVVYINHTSDNRTEGPFSTHNPMYTDTLTERIDAKDCLKLGDILPEILHYDIIGIDEAQFFPDLVDIVLRCVEKYNKHVIVAGLTTDCFRNKFGFISDLIHYSDTYTSLPAYCAQCATEKRRREAIFTYRFSDNTEQTCVGGKDKYLPLCRGCYINKSEM